VKNQLQTLARFKCNLCRYVAGRLGGGGSGSGGLLARLSSAPSLPESQLSTPSISDSDEERDEEEEEDEEEEDEDNYEDDEDEEE
jgi:hypothetical protein